MWCNCVTLPENQLGCMNIPFSTNPFSEITIRIKFIGQTIDFSNPDVEDAFFLVRKLDDRRSANYTVMSINNGDLIIDPTDSTKLKVTFNSRMINYIGDTLFFQFFLKEGGENYPLATGKFFREVNYL